MSGKMYRFESDGIGIFEALNRDCPQDDKRRQNRPTPEWPSKVGEKFVGAISFLTEKGFKQYRSSGVRDWHASIVKNPIAIIMAKIPDNVLYCDEFQIICERESVEIENTWMASYLGPKEEIVARKEDERPAFIRHHSSLRDWLAYAYYFNGSLDDSESLETFTCGAAIGESLGLKHVGIHHEYLLPGKRSSWPHAHWKEEELVYILKGNPKIWINGKKYHAIPGDIFYFPPGTGLAHTILNETEEIVEMLVLGEQDQDEDKVFYPLHERRNFQCQALNFFWEDHPPYVDRTQADSPTYEHQKNYLDINKVDCGEKDNEAKVFYWDRDLGRSLGATRVALHHVIIPAGFRSSYPHAESTEEEFVYVLRGNPGAWIDGTLYLLEEGDCVAFPAGTGITHTMINSTNKDVELIVAGDTGKKDNRCAFPLNPELKDRVDIWWENPPQRTFENASPMPIQNSLKD